MSRVISVDGRSYMQRGVNIIQSLIRLCLSVPSGNILISNIYWWRCCRANLHKWLTWYEHDRNKATSDKEWVELIYLVISRRRKTVNPRKRQKSWLYGRNIGGININWFTCLIGYKALFTTFVFLGKLLFWELRPLVVHAEAHRFNAALALNLIMFWQI